MEIYKNIPGYNNYQISNHGRVKNVLTNRILNDRKIFGGYLQVALYENKIRKVFMVHRLVYCVFNNINLIFTGHNTKNLVCHINDIRNDNRLENLFIGTNKENIDDCISKGRYSRKSISKKVMQMFNGEKIAEFSSIRQASLSTGVERTMIGGCCHGVRKTGGGFEWAYA